MKFVRVIDIGTLTGIIANKHLFLEAAVTGGSGDVKKLSSDFDVGAFRCSVDFPIFRIINGKPNEVRQKITFQIFFLILIVVSVGGLSNRSWRRRNIGILCPW